MIPVPPTRSLSPRGATTTPQRAVAPLLAVALLGGACVGPAMLTDGTSVSYGTVSGGVLRHGSALPVRGEGYLVPDRWRQRGRQYGTDELVQLLVRVARRVAREYPGGLLGVADLSPPGGGATPEHRSHRTGRDADLIFYATDMSGRPARPERMVRFDAAGRSVVPDPPSGDAAQATAAAPGAPEATLAAPEVRRFDLTRNWALVRALVTDPLVPVQWIFIGRPLARLLLDHARRTREPETVIQRAAIAMHQPTDAQSHMDHVHIRVFCAPSDRRLGCRDVGPPRWMAKSIKYADEPERVHLPLEQIQRLVLGPHRFPLL